MKITTTLMLLASLTLLTAGCDSPTDPDESGRLEPQRALAVGEQHACVLTEDGEAYCWGGNGTGQLGNNSIANSPVPVKVAGGLRFVEIRAGGRHTCALTADGDAYCWGANGVGELGNGRSTPDVVPALVAGGLKFASLGGGGFQHTCARTRDGQVYCWGGDRNGQLGYATTETCAFGGGTIGCSRTPRQATLPGSASAVSAGFLQSCALRSGGVATCWGDNSAGQLGTNTTGTHTAPTDVAGSVRFASLSGGSLHTCGLDSSGRGYCWGDGTVGTLGTSSTTASLVPVPVSGGLAFRQVSASSGNSVLGHTCAVTSDGRGYCWGANQLGQLGVLDAGQTCTSRIGSTVSCSQAPRAVTGSEQWAAVAAGSHFTCAINTVGTAFCWGANGAGQLGSGSTASSSAVPQPVSGGLRLPRGR